MDGPLPLALQPLPSTSKLESPMEGRLPLSLQPLPSTAKLFLPLTLPPFPPLPPLPSTSTVSGPQKAEPLNTSTPKPRTRGQVSEEEINLGEIIVVGNGPEAKYKRHYCYYCGKDQTVLNRHFRLKHKSEEDVSWAISVASMKKRLEMFEHLKWKGNHHHNIAVMKQKSGYFVVSRRPGENETGQYTDYGPCYACFKYLTKTELGKHQKNCKELKKMSGNGDEVLGQKGMATKSDLLLLQDVSPYTREMQHLLTKLRYDQIGKVIRGDETIIKIGQELLDKETKELKEEKMSLIKSRMRELARLLVAMRDAVKDQSRTLESFIYVDYFNLFIDSVKTVCFKEGQETKDLNSLARQIGFNMKKVVNCVWTKRTITRDETGAEEARKFEELLAKNGNTLLFSRSKKAIHLAHLNKKKVMPKETDIVKLASGLKEDINDLTQSLSDTFAEDKYFILLRKVCAYLIVYNRQRPTAMAQTKVGDYQEAKKADFGKDEQELDLLNAKERAMIDQHVLMKNVGKRQRHLHVLIPLPVDAALQLLIALRSQAGVPSNNPYLFATKRGSQQKYVAAASLIGKYALEYQCEEPEAIRATTLRKQLGKSFSTLLNDAYSKLFVFLIATNVRLLNINNHEMEQVADHMGHDLNVNEKYYRLSQDVLERTKIASILSAIESGELKKYRGKELDTFIAEHHHRFLIDEYADGDSSDEEEDAE